jgi:peroxiredoxin Q/BCP
MKRVLAGLALSAAFALPAAAPAWATLEIGAPAPSFKTRATLAGKEFDFSLAEALRKGPVVLYFYPAAFTKGCTIEANMFAEATAKFQEMGATVIGVSRDPIEKLNQFSVQECRNKFAVAADPDGSIMKDYDAILKLKPELADRTSYVISPDSKILMAYSELKPDEHVARTMAAVEKYRTEHHKK